MFIEQFYQSNLNFTMSENRTHRSFVSYIDKSRDYYAAQGYTLPYKWVYHKEVPFNKLSKPLSDCTVGLVTTANTSSVLAKPPEGTVSSSEKTLRRNFISSSGRNVYQRFGVG